MYTLYGEKMKLWKGNLLKGEYEATLEEIYNGFMESIHYLRWIQHKTKCDLRGSLAMYLISSDDGLASTFEQDDFNKLYEYIKHRVEEYLKTEEDKYALS